MEGGEEAWQWQTEKIFWSVIAIVVSFLVLTILEKLWLKIQRIRSVLHKQGITGPTPSFPWGNLSEVQRIQSHYSNLSSSSFPISSDQWFSFLFPYLQQWRKQYGPTYLYFIRSKQHLYVGDPELLKELNLTRSLDLGKSPTMSKVVKPLLGDGILMANGQYWSFQRNIIAPQFFLSKIQNMVAMIEESTREIMRKWERCIGESGGKMAEIVIDNDLKALTTDVICKACFGSSYVQGIQIFDKLASLQSALAKPSLPFGISILRYLPTKGNREIWRLEKEIEKLILTVVEDREKENQGQVNLNQKDLLQITIDSVTIDANDYSGWRTLKKLRHKQHEAKKLIVDMCKNIYFAGSESTAVLVTWTLIILAFNPQRQECLRSEILDTFPNMSPHCFRDMDKFRKLKLLTMVIQECLRLYSPGIVVSREALEEIKLGELVVPKGTIIQFFIQALHRDADIWGQDATEFKPERFLGGVSEACKNPNAYIPFGVGSRICLAQNFALTEAKIMLSLLLSNFSFSISPNYRHFPSYKMLLKPKYGAPILVTKL
ncbi:cytochrome P450 714A1-like [Prosopis cineraria]|uniref:cytochrome P450 714A1-like n=1 Tax=Prosopis cineraria TaxID=364024 RepID=UPI0024103313|nr:cytochrome P450 714A1-like [Prosopis cineraria]